MVSLDTDFFHYFILPFVSSSNDDCNYFLGSFDADFFFSFVEHALCHVVPW